jgi:hypothetical protein
MAPNAETIAHHGRQAAGRKPLQTDHRRAGRTGNSCSGSLYANTIKWKLEAPDLEQSSRHLPISFMSGFESRAAFKGVRCTTGRKPLQTEQRGGGAPWAGRPDRRSSDAIDPAVKYQRAP